jgi:GDP-4-dehydro-6-deoxy-D-mannose reductase
MKALITGGYGFAGRHLAEHLVKCGEDVALSYHPIKNEKESDNLYPVPKTVQSIALDVTDSNAVNQIISVLKPDVIYHLAGITFIPEAENQLDKVFEINTFGTVNVLNAVRDHAKDSRVLFVSSAEVYGDARPGSLPLTEKAELRPVTTYGASKAAADLIAFQYAYRENIHVIRARPFTHIGPGQSDNFSISNFSKQVALIKLGRAKPIIQVGNLEAKRDFSDVSDIVRGYRESVLNGKRGEAYNLCSGVSIEIKEVLQKLISIAEIEVEIVIDETRLRPIDIPELCGSYQRAQKHFGWKPRVHLDQTLHSLLAYWLEALST